MEVVTAMKTVARHLTKCLNESSPNTDLSKLEQLTVPAFMLTLYREITDSSKVMEAIGIHSQTLTVSQFDCIINLPLTGIFSCLQMFVQWISDGTYDFCSLPVSHKAKLSRADQAALQEIPQKWHGKGEREIFCLINEQVYMHTYIHTHCREHTWAVCWTTTNEWSAGSFWSRYLQSSCWYFSCAISQEYTDDCWWGLSACPPTFYHLPTTLCIS